MFSVCFVNFILEFLVRARTTQFESDRDFIQSQTATCIPQSNQANPNLNHFFFCSETKRLVNWYT